MSRKIRLQSECSALTGVDRMDRRERSAGLVTVLQKKETLAAGACFSNCSGQERSKLMSAWISYPLLIVAGLALVLAFAPFDQYWIAFIAPAALILSWRNKSPRACLWRGFTFGLSFFGLGVSWVYNSIHEFGQAPMLFAGFLTGAFVLIMAVYPALVGWFQARWFGNLSWRYRCLLLIPALWVISEWLRGWLFTGFPWLFLGHTQLSSSLAGYLPVGGSLLVSWLVLMVSSLWLTLLDTRAWRVRWLSVGAMLVIFALGYGLRVIEWTRPSGPPLSIALVQGNIAQENKWSDKWLLPTINRYTELTQAHLDRDLIVWPEVALPGTYQLFAQSVFEPLRAKLRHSNTDLLSGILYAEQEHVYNSLVKLGEDIEFYHKRHLVPFGEYIPFRRWASWFDSLIVLPADDVLPATRAVVLKTHGHRIAGSICYEDAYGEEMADMLPEADILVNVSNDAWFGDSFAPTQHLQIARIRAAEFGRPLLRATNTGITALVDYHGQVQQSVPQFKTEVLTGQVQGREGVTPYLWRLNQPVLGLLAVLVLMSAYLGWRSRQ